MSYAQYGIDARWYSEDHEMDRAVKISDVAGRLWRDLEPTRQSMVTAARLYGNAPLLGLSPRLYRQKQMSTRSRRLSLNVIKSVVDTYVSLVTKDRPKISFCTSGGDWSVQRKAKLLEKFVDGTFYEASLHLTAQQCARDSALFGLGIVKLYADMADKPQICIERVLPWELLVDDQEAAYGDPRCMYHVKFIDRQVLKEMYPDKSDDIQTASSGMFDETGTEYEIQADMVDLAAVVEAWHLPGLDPKKDPGRHSVCIGNVLLEDEEYEYENFPFEILYRQKPIQGIWGQSLADELAPLQVEIARLLMTIQRSQMLAVGHWLVEENSRVNTNAINDVVASIIRYAGVRPEYVHFQPVSNDVYAHLDRLWSRAFEVVGISQMTAQSQKPAGLNSGKAMLVYADVQSQRFQPCYREYQHWYLNLARQCIHLARKISETHSDFDVKGMSQSGRNMMKTVKWADANLDDEEFTLQLFPTNALADDPAARLQVVQDMINAGMINPEDGRRLLDMPDLEALHSYENSSYDCVMAAAERIIESGEFFPPEPYMNLDDSIKRMQLCYLKARLDQVPEDKLDLLRRWIDEAAAMLQPPPPPAPPPGAGAPPPGPEGAPPPGPPGMGGQVQHMIQRGVARQTAQNLG